MRGKIEPGQLCTVGPVAPATLEVGDVVLCEVNGRHYLHLVKAILGRRFQIGNNRGRVNGWVGENGVFGKCTRIESYTPAWAGREQVADDRPDRQAQPQQRQRTDGHGPPASRGRKGGGFIAAPRVACVGPSRRKAGRSAAPKEDCPHKGARPGRMLSW
jgi:hypothetical protein